MGDGGPHESEGGTAQTLSCSSQPPRVGLLSRASPLTQPLLATAWKGQQAREGWGRLGAQHRPARGLGLAAPQLLSLGGLPPPCRPHGEHELPCPGKPERGQAVLPPRSTPSPSGSHPPRGQSLRAAVGGCSSTGPAWVQIPGPALLALELQELLHLSRPPAPRL